MDHAAHNKLVSFIWSIADDCLRDVYVRGKYRDVILPMFVLRRLDCLLEESKEKVLEEVRFQRDDAELTELDPTGLTEASGYVFYNTSRWTLKRLVDTASNNRQILEGNFNSYLNGFSDNVKEIIDSFELRNQIRRMVQADVLLDVLEKFSDPRINLSPHPVLDPDGRTLPALTNHGMGYVFEELIRRFNEENNEEAGEHFTPREVIRLMIHLLFMPLKDALPPVLTIYDGACGSGGMLTESQNFITAADGAVRYDGQIHLYGKEVNAETYAICKSDMMIKGNDPENIHFGSTLATDDFGHMKFDIMLENPPYGKSWKTDQRVILDGKEVMDPRFEVPLTNFDGTREMKPAIPRSSDGQLLFLMDMVQKMKPVADSPSGARVASVHNGSSLFTGDAGSGESNIRRYIIENDLLETIIQLPQNLFYNTGISTYIWLLSNNKRTDRRGKVQLIDASELYRKLRKNLGAKNCEFAPEHIAAITQTYLDMGVIASEETAVLSSSGAAVRDTGRVELERGLVSKTFDNADFGYYKVTVERPLRLAAQFSPERIETLRFVPALQEPMTWAYEKWGDAIYDEMADHRKEIEEYLEEEAISLSPKNKKQLLSAETWHKQLSLLQTAEQLMHKVGQDLHTDFNHFADLVDAAIKAVGKESGVKLSSSEKKQILNAISWRDENAAKVVKKIHKFKPDKLADLLAKLNTTAEHLHDFGYWLPSVQSTPNTESTTNPTTVPLLSRERLGEGVFIEYETDSDLRDTESVPLKEEIHAYFLREVRPHVADAWINLGKTQIGYEISFNKYFYQHTPLRSLEDVTAEILALEAETEGLLRKLVQFGDR